MIYLRLFLSFLKIGAFTFGGGYAMISVILETVNTRDWLSEEELLDFIAVAESTPGPIAVNLATFIGSSQGGILGAFVATAGVVLPSFIIILVITAILSNLLKYKGVTAFLNGVRPCVAAMISATAVILGLSVLFSFSSLGDSFSPDIKGILIFALLLAIHFVYKAVTKKKPSPVLMILISACMGILLYS